MSRCLKMQYPYKFVFFSFSYHSLLHSLFPLILIPRKALLSLTITIQPTLPIFTNTADSSFTIAPADALTSAAEQPVSIPIASTATPLAAVASPGPTQPTAPAPRTSSLPPSTPSAGATLAPPPAPSPHGSPTRVYLNQNVTPHLLEGMKYLAVYE